MKEETYIWDKSQAWEWARRMGVRRLLPPVLNIYDFDIEAIKEFKFRLFKEPQIKQIKQIWSVLNVMIPVRYYTDSLQHASQVLTARLAERHSKAAEPFAGNQCNYMDFSYERMNVGKRIC